jgi:hypothetical protein
VLRALRRQVKPTTSAALRCAPAQLYNQRGPGDL